MNNFKVSKLHIIIPGDESVGLFTSRWTLEPEMFFESKDTFEEFKENILQVFETAFGEVTYIETQEEIDEREHQFLKLHEESFKTITEADYVESPSEEELIKQIEKDYNNE